MRPIETDSRAATYSQDEQLDRSLFEMEDSEGEERLEKRRRALDTSVSRKLNDLNTLLADHWDPGRQWDSSANRQKARRLLNKIGTGYEDAARSLISQTGQYCAYCDAPVFSDLRSAPILPLRWFPTQAFDYDKQLLMCPSCRAAKEERPSRVDGSADVLLDSNHLAWPQFFAQRLLDGALLPFRYDLVWLTWTFGPPRVSRIIGQDEIDSLLRSYRHGYVRVERANLFKRGQVLVWPPGSDTDSDLDWDEFQPPPLEPTPVGAWVSSTSTDRPVEAGVQRLIDLLQLNGIARSDQVDGLDRRFELRTMAYLKALDLRERIVSVWALRDTDPEANDLLDKIMDLWRPTIQATGFWGVWLSVFSNMPDIQSHLAALMPGTDARTWVL